MSQAYLGILATIFTVIGSLLVSAWVVQAERTTAQRDISDLRERMEKQEQESGTVLQKLRETVAVTTERVSALERSVAGRRGADR